MAKSHYFLCEQRNLTPFLRQPQSTAKTPGSKYAGNVISKSRSIFKLTLQNKHVYFLKNDQVVNQFKECTSDSLHPGENEAILAVYHWKQLLL